VFVNITRYVRLIDKPVGFSSYQMVRVFTSCYDKVGHAGTLDPCASGLLIILIGKATKRSQALQQCEKEYVGELLLGMTTDTYDMSGNVERIWSQHARQRACSPPPFSIDVLNSVAQVFVGTIEQEPPRYSALKHKGRKLYELSRKGIRVRPQRRKVFIRSFSVIAYTHPVVSFATVVGKGVYIRSLAHDIGTELGTGATLLSLRRTKIGDYSVDDAETFGSVLDEMST
jgi:tRNA pseudouridine55 synthase